MLGGRGLLNIGGAFFLQIPEESTERILHPAKVVGLTGNILTAEFEDRDLGITEFHHIVEREDLFIFFEARNSFLRQAACVLKILDDEPRPTIEFETTGEPVSAQSRECYRVSSITAGLTAKLAGEDQCPLLDVSCTGFSVISSRNYAFGSLVEATLIYQGEEYNDTVCVQSIRELSKGRIRYGLRCLEDRASAGNLPIGLRRMTVVLESEQLRRLTGTT